MNRPTVAPALVVHSLVLSLVAVTMLAVPARAADPHANPWWKAGHAAAERARDESGVKGRAKNVILFVGDGMGIATVTAARILAGQRAGKTGEENRLSFETLPFTALSKTYNTDFQVPDSAGTISAMTTGVKTRMGVLGIDETVPRGDFAAAAAGSVPTILEQAEDRGLWTGVVTTTTVTHATPAGTYAHTPERNWEGDAKLSDAARQAGFPDIARQLIEQAHGNGPEVVLGGGRAFFLPADRADPERPDVKGTRLDGRDLVAEWQKKNPGGEYAWNAAQLEQVDGKTAPKILGLFDPGHMQFNADRAKDPGGEPTLAQMTAKALDVLQRAPEGYFLLVEGGRIDHGHHAGNAYRALDETIGFADAVQLALERTNPADTLIVVTADHSHTLTISGYPKRGNPILGLVVGALGEDKVSDQPAPDLTGRPYTTLNYANGPGYTGKSDAQPAGVKHFPHLPKSYEGITQGRPDLSTVDVTSPDYLEESTIALGSETHGGEDVGIWARGPGAPAFHGTQEQNFIYHAMAQALGWD
ncbi:alkaline phosphatase [Candidatus Binatia bacterium]|nr:alkaline phosphatase [Candidatus Binatia bacterium]